MQPTGMRAVNGVQLLTLIRESGPISRAALSKLSGLSKPTVSEQIKRLIEQGSAIELGTGKGTAAGGKKPTMVDFHADSGRIFAISIGSEETRIQCADLRGNVRREARFETETRVLSRINKTLSVIADQERRPVRAVAVGTPGRVDCDQGVVVDANRLEWKRVDIRSALSRHFDVPVLVDNDVKLALTGELQFGAAKHARTAVLIRLGPGIGSAVAIHGDVHHGAHWAAGEVGHLSTSFGELESVLGSERIAARVRSAARQSAALRKLLKNGSPVAALFDAAAKHDAQATKIASDVVQHLNVTVASQASAYDPDIVLLSGELFDYTLPAIEQFLRKTIPWPIKVAKAILGDEAVLAGAIHLGLTSAYDEMSRRLHSPKRPATGRAAYA